MLKSNNLSSPFRERFHALLGDEFDTFIENLQQPSVHFLRINTLKISIKQGLARLSDLNVEAIPLPWFSAGFRIIGAYDQLPFSKEYALGYYYIQEGGSMIPPVALDLTSKHTLLDLCAAPGSKTTQIAQIMNNHGVILANDRTYRRITSLGHNLQLCGVANTIIFCEDGRHLHQHLNIQFDRILVDAPCTASGHLRSKPPQYHSPDQKRILGLQALQKGLLTSGFRLLKPHGKLVYSTCSLNPEENESVVNHLLSKFPNATLNQPQIPGLSSHHGLDEWRKELYDETLDRCLRVYPHDNDTDGFFIALIRKENA